MSKVNFVIFMKLEWKIVYFFLVVNSRFSEWNTMYYKTFFFFFSTNCCCLLQDIRTTRAVFHFLLSKHKWSQYDKSKSLLSVATSLCQLIPKNVLSVPKCSIWVSVGMIYFNLFGNAMWRNKPFTKTFSHWEEISLSVILQTDFVFYFFG